MANTPPLNIHEGSVAGFIDLTTLEDALLATPQPLYLFRFHVSTKYGPNRPNMGSKVQVNRWKPLTPPNPDSLSAYDAGTGPNSIDITNAANLQAQDWSSVEISVKRRNMPKPVAAKFETAQLSQVDIQFGHRIGLQTNYNEFIDDLIREAYRAAVCTQIFGGALRNTASVMANVPATDGLNVAMLKEFKRRAASPGFHIRPFGSVPGGDAQALTGTFLCIADQHGINEITEDPLWRDMAIRDPAAEKVKLIKGYFGELEQVTVVKSERMRTTTVGPSGGTFAAHEALFIATDPTLIDPGENGVQGFVGEYPVVIAMVGAPEVKGAVTPFGEDLIFTWFHTMGVKALEELSATDAGALTAALGGHANNNLGQAATGSSRFIHRGLYA